MDYVGEIKEKLTLSEIVQRYGFNLNRQKRMPCPFHNGHDSNLSIKDNFYYCFVCGAGGDSIKFVQNLFGLSFMDAVKKINDDFCLSLPIGEKLDAQQKKEIAKRQQERKRELQRKEAERQRIEGEYWKAFDEWLRLDTIIREFQPVSATEQPMPIYLDALKKINCAIENLERAEMMRCKI